MPVSLYTTKPCPKIASWSGAIRARGDYDPESHVWKGRIGFCDKQDEDTQIAVFKLGDAPDDPEFRDLVCTRLI